MTNMALPQIDLLNGHLYASDPTPTYSWLRESAPVYWDDINELWGISRYADIVALEADPRTYSNRNAFRPLPPPEHDDVSMIGQDDPRHQSQRRLVARRFTPRAVSCHASQIRARVVDLIEAFVDDGECDIVEALAAPLPAMMIAEFLGFGVDRWQEIKRWSEDTIPLGGGPRYQTDVGITAAFECYAACVELIAKRRIEPQDDLVSVWCHTEVDGRLMTDDEIVAECLLVVDGGAETTRTVIASTVWDLCLHPEQMAALVAEPSLLDTGAVEEFIRYTTPILNMARVVTVDHELHGQSLVAGQQLLLMYSSANRDPSVFERPDDFDVRRSHNHHVSFGFGSHFCLGASLARLELRIVFDELIRRITNVALVDGDAPSRVPGAFVRGVARVPVTFDRR